MKLPFLALVLLSAAGPAMACDLLIRGARVIDGSGAPGFDADVAITGDRIDAVGPGLAPCTRTVEANGRALAPGFIDSHAHGDPLESPMVNFLSQGVTTIVLGQDGRTPGASDEDDETGGMKDFAQWRAAVEAHGPTLNVAALTGLGTLRARAGAGAAPTVTPAQQAEMERLLKADLDAGALGLSSGLEYAPDRYASRDELLGLARVVGAAEGVIESHMRTEDDDKIEGAIDELADQGRYARVHVSHIKVVVGHGRARGEAIVRKLEDLRAKGVKISADVYPYTAGFADFSLDYPAWAKREGEWVEAARSRRAELEAGIKARLDVRNGAQAVLIASGPDAGLTLDKAAAKAGKRPEAYVVDAGFGGPAAAHFVMDDALQEAFVRSDVIAFSTDGSPGMKHPRSWGSYSRLIEEFVRKRKTLSMEAMVRKATGYPAREILGLTDRGFVKPGMKADLVLFDPAKVKALATWEKPAVASEGFDLVLVNGQVAWEGGRATGAKVGRMLTRPVSVTPAKAGAQQLPTLR